MPGVQRDAGAWDKFDAGTDSETDSDSDGRVVRVNMGESSDDEATPDEYRWLGDERILWESDFPHPDSKYPHTTKEFLSLTPDAISLESKRRIFWDNAVDFYRFPEGYLPSDFKEATDVPLVAA